jgi:hypothetical protein
MSLTDSQIQGLLIAARETHAEEIDCSQFLDSMAALAEARAEGRAVPELLARAVEHERLCQNCREECAALIAMLES